MKTTNDLKISRSVFAKMWERGDSLTEIAEHFGISYSNAAQTRLRLGLPRRVRKYIIVD